MRIDIIINSDRPCSMFIFIYLVLITSQIHLTKRKMQFTMNMFSVSVSVPYNNNLITCNLSIPIDSELLFAKQTDKKKTTKQQKEEIFHMIWWPVILIDSILYFGKNIKFHSFLIQSCALCTALHWILVNGIGSCCRSISSYFFFTHIITKNNISIIFTGPNTKACVMVSVSLQSFFFFLNMMK